MHKIYVVGIVVTGLAAPVGAQDTVVAYPVKPIRIIVPFTAGASSDVLGRVVLERMSKLLKQPMFIENKTGAGGTIGVDAVVKAAPDGYTLLLTTSSPLTINPLIDKSVKYNVQKDLTPISVLNTVGLLLVSKPDFPAKNLNELIMEVKRHPGKYSFASNGNGSYSHMAMELFMNEMGLNLTHIPYRGAGQAETDVMGGQVTFMFDSVATGSEFVRAGRLKSYGISSCLPDKLQPQHQPIATQGVPQLANFDVAAFTGLLAPAGTPRKVVDRLQAAAVEVLKDPQLRVQLASRNIPLAQVNEATTMEQKLKTDHAKWEALVTAANIKLD